MLQTMEDLKKADLVVHPVINGVDNPNLRSVDSTAVLETPVDYNPGEERPASKEKKEVAPAEVKEPVVEKKDEEGAEVVKPADKDAVQKRINELTRKFRSTERELNHERKVGQEKEAKLLAEIAELKAKIGVQEDVAPDREKFDSDAEYYIALADWRFDQKVKELAKNAETAPKTEQQTTPEVREIDKVLDAGATKYEDFDELVHSEDFTFTQEMADAILQSEDEAIAADILYHLSQNLELAEEISKMSPAKMAREIGKLEVLVTKQSEPTTNTEPKKEEVVETKPTPKPKPVSTPEPITPVRTTGAYDKDPASMSMREYKAFRKKNKE